MLRIRGRRGSAAVILLALLLPYCGKTDEGGSSESHFLVSCDGSCAPGLSCICGVCTKTCSDDAICEALSPAASCVDRASNPTCPALPKPPSGSTCDVPCSGDAACSQFGDGYACVGGRCRPPGVDLGGTAGSGGSGGGGGSAGGGGTQSQGGSAASAGMQPQGGGGSGGESGLQGVEEGPETVNSSYQGTVTLRNSAEEEGSLTVSASFVTIGSSMMCRSVTRYGDCTLKDLGQCARTANVEQTVSAGVVTVSSTDPELMLALEPTSVGALVGVEYPDVESSTTFAGGETLSLSIPGDEAPAFSRTFSMPVPIEIDAPAATPDGVILTDGRGDLVLTFGRGSPGSVLRASSTGSGYLLSCLVPEDAGSLVITAGVLTRLGPGTIINLWTETSETAAIDEWKITRTAMMDARTPDAPVASIVVMNEPRTP